MRESSRHDSFTVLRDQTRWRVAMVLSTFGFVTLLLLGLANHASGRGDSVNLAIGAALALALCGLVLLWLPRSLGGRLYFWFTVLLLMYVPYFGYEHGRTFHYWAYALPPTLFFVMSTRAALLVMVAFGLYAGVMQLPFTAPVDVVRFWLSYLLLVAFVYAFAWLEERAGVMLRYASDHDALTNCWNRRIFNETLDQRAAESAGSPGLTLLLLDIDHFKSINDTLGHLVGDRVITQVAAALGRVLDGDTHLYRYGGEEFAVIARALDDDGARALGESLRAAVAGADFGGPAVTISVGVAHWRGHGDPLPATLAAADQALYAAKRAGRNRVELAGQGPDAPESLPAPA